MKHVDKHGPVTYFDPNKLGQCESATREGRRCVRNAGVIEKRNGKEVRLCRHHRQKGAFRPLVEVEA